MPQDYRLVFLTPIAFIVALIVGYEMGLLLSTIITWSLVFTGMFGLIFLFLAYPRGREDWPFSLGETLSMFGIIVIALAIVGLVFYIMVRWENPDWRTIGIYIAFIILIIMGIFGVFVRLHGSSGLAAGGGGGGYWWEDMGGAGGGGGQQQWGVPEVEARYGKQYGWANVPQQPKR